MGVKRVARQDPGKTDKTPTKDDKCIVFMLIKSMQKRLVRLSSTDRLLPVDKMRNVA